jgi:hypothetical protein
MTNGSWIAVSALVGLMATSAAQADVTTIDADPYTSGTDVSTVFDGVTLAHVTWANGGYQSTAAYTSSCGTAPSPVCNALGLAAFAWQTPTGTFSKNWTLDSTATVETCLQNPAYSRCSSVPQHILELSFDADTDFIQFDSTYTNDWPDVLAFDAAGNVVTVTKQVTILQTYTAGVLYGHQVLMVSSASANISRVWIAGSGGNSTVNVVSFKR